MEIFTSSWVYATDLFFLASVRNTLFYIMFCFSVSMSFVWIYIEIFQIFLYYFSTLHVYFLKKKLFGVFIYEHNFHRIIVHCEMHYTCATSLRWYLEFAWKSKKIDEVQLKLLTNSNPRPPASWSCLRNCSTWHVKPLIIQWQ